MTVPQRILIVDDEETIREICVRALAPLGYAVETAAQAQQAMSCFQNGPFDLMITDDRMPGSMGGLVLAQEIKHRFPETRIILMTGFPTLENALAALSVGASDYLVKPFGAKELVDYVQRCYQTPGEIAQPSFASTLANAAPVTPSQAAQSTLPKILLVDDSKVTLMIFKSFFEKSGYQVLTATDGEDALALAQSKKPDLVILDGELPRLNGFEVCRRLREKDDMKGTKIIMFTGGIEGNEHQQAQKAGADFFLSKETPAAELLKTARQLLQG
jgi:DNA-binding response OmpR family regulator